MRGTATPATSAAAPPGGGAAVAAAAHSAGVAVTRIGRIAAEPGLSVIDADGQRLQFDKAGYDHFAA